MEESQAKRDNGKRLRSITKMVGRWVIWMVVKELLRYTLEGWIEE